jgi:hypothetical protein
MAIPTSLNDAKDSIASIIKHCHNQGIVKRSDIEERVVKMTHSHNLSLNQTLCASLVTFDAIGDTFDRLKWNINIIQDNEIRIKNEKITGIKSTQGFEHLTDELSIHPDAYGNSTHNKKLGELTGMTDIEQI